MNATRLIEVIFPVLDDCSFTCKPSSNRIELFNKKNVLCGHISEEGNVIEKRLGKQNLLGALLKRNLVDAIEKELAANPVSR